MIYYGYRKCSTCRDALKWLQQHGIEVEQREIRETPPTPAELASALRIFGGDRKKLLNLSGAEYRAMGLKDRLDAMTDEQVFALIQENGNLCKRPFLIDEKNGIALTGFRIEEWQKLLDAK